MAGDGITLNLAGIGVGRLNYLAKLPTAASALPNIQFSRNVGQQKIIARLTKLMGC